MDRRREHHDIAPWYSRGRGAKEEPKLGICGEHRGEAESVAFSCELGLARLAATRRRR